jgi:hypothetical protein
MKKILTLVIAFMLTVTIVHAQQGWVSHKIDNRITIKFPVEPKEIIPGTFASKGSDSLAYVLTVVDFVKVANIDSAALAPVKETPEFASQLKSGMSQSLPDVQFQDFELGKWKGFTSYTTSGVDSKKKKYDIFMFIIGTKLYSLSTIMESNGNSKGTGEFFKSVILTN